MWNSGAHSFYLFGDFLSIVFWSSLRSVSLLNELSIAFCFIFHCLQRMIALRVLVFLFEFSARLKIWQKIYDAEISRIIQFYHNKNIIRRIRGLAREGAGEGFLYALDGIYALEKIKNLLGRSKMMWTPISRGKDSTDFHILSCRL